MADYFFRDDIEADKQRAADAAANGVAPTLAAPAPTAPAAQPQAATDKTFANLGKAAAGATAAPAPKPDYFADFRSAMDAEDPFKQQTQKAITDSLKNPTAAFDAGASAQQDKLGRETAAEQERRRQQAVLQFGGNATGQVGKAMDSFGNEALMKQAELGRDLAAGRAAAGEATRTNAINQSIGLQSEKRQTAATAADIGLRQTGQQEQASIAEKQLAENARQFDTQQAFTEYATKEGWNQDAIARAWQSMENTKAQGATKEIAFAQIGSTERIQQSSQAHDTAEKALDRSLESMLSNDRIQAQFQLADITNAFNEKMQTAGFVHDTELETMRSDLQKTLQARGIQADVAKQLADQKYDELKSAKDQAFQEKMTDINQKFTTGERIDTQTWETSLKTLDQRHDELMQEREQAAAKGLQTDRLEAEINENAKQRASQEMMSTAQLAMSDKQFMAELQQQYDFNDKDMAIRVQQLQSQLDLAGLQGEQLKQAMGDAKVDSAVKMATLGMEIGNGSPESMAPFVEALGTALSGYMKGQGIDITSADFAKALASTNPTGAPGSTKAAFNEFDKVVDEKAGVVSPEIADELKAYAKTVTNAYSSAAPGSWISLSSGSGSDFDAAAARLREKTGKQDLGAIVSRDRVDGAFQSHYEYEGTPEFGNYMVYTKLLKSGLGEADAKTALSSLIGADKAKAALALEGGK